MSETSAICQSNRAAAERRRAPGRRDPGAGGQSWLNLRTHCDIQCAEDAAERTIQRVRPRESAGGAPTLARLQVASLESRLRLQLPVEVSTSLVSSGLDWLVSCLVVCLAFPQRYSRHSRPNSEESLHRL